MHLLNSPGLKAGAIDLRYLVGFSQIINTKFYFTFPINLFKNGTVNISNRLITAEVILILKPELVEGGMFIKETISLNRLRQAQADNFYF